MSSDDVIVVMGALAFFVNATTGALAVYLWLRRLQKIARRERLSQPEGRAFEVNSISSGIRRVREDYLAAQRGPARPHRRGLLAAARLAVVRMPYFCQGRLEASASTVPSGLISHETETRR
jgi:hypothetical protein